MEGRQRPCSYQGVAREREQHPQVLGVGGDMVAGGRHSQGQGRTCEWASSWDSAEFRERVLVKTDSEVLKWVSLGTLAEMAFMAKIGHVLCIERARKISKVWYQKNDIFVFWR